MKKKNFYLIKKNIVLNEMCQHNNKKEHAMFNKRMINLASGIMPRHAMYAEC